MSKTTRAIRSLAAVASHRVVDVAIVGGHQAWLGWTQLKGHLDPRHLGRQLAQARRQLQAEIQVAARA